MKLVAILNVFTNINFSCNNFQWEISKEIGDLKSLYVLNLSQNGFTGQVPLRLENLKQLESLDLSLYNLIGEIPPQLLKPHFPFILEPLIQSTRRDDTERQPNPNIHKSFIPRK
ncbi:hypothetical protein ACSBR2_021828 [Camellia fascicularis]